MAGARITVQLSLEEVEHIAYELAQEHLTFNEPIPDFHTRIPNALESCIATPFMKFGGKAVYRGLAAQASALFYYMIKDRPFQNGNKRIAIMTGLFLLHKHKKWLRAEMRELYELTIWVAKSHRTEKDFVIMAIKEFFKAHLVIMK